MTVNPRHPVAAPDDAPSPSPEVPPAAVCPASERTARAGARNGAPRSVRGALAASGATSGEGAASAREILGPPPPQGRWDAFRRRLELQRHTLDSVEHRFAVYGDVHRAPILGREGYSYCHPEHVREVLVEHAAKFAKRKFSVDTLGDGLLLSDGEVWRRRRRLVQPGFRSEALRRYGELIEEEIQTLIEKIARSPVVELRSLMMQFALRVVCRTLFGQSFRGDGRQLARAIMVLNRTAILPELPRWAPNPVRALSEHMRGVIDREVFAMLDDADSGQGSLLWDLQHPADPSARLTRTELRDEAVTLFLAGHETTALALTWALYLVAQHPNVEGDVLREVRRVAPDGPPRAADIDALEQSQRVLKETLRLYPPAYVLPRVCVEPVTVGGAALQPGDEVWLWLYMMQRDPRWYQLPTRFVPERFAPGGEHERQPLAYAPFGAGTRICIGRQFAVMEGVLALSSLLSRFHFELLDVRPLRPLPRVTLAPARPLHARVELRR